MILKIAAIRQEASNSISIIFERPRGLNFYPGQYLDIELPVMDPLGTARILSIASSPSEDFVMVTYHTGISVYKKYIEKLKPGNTVESSHPAGTVVIDDSSPLIMIAGGIGIAPYRSMIKWAVDRQLKIPITLIYSNSNEDIIFKEELDQWQTQLPSLKIHYIITSKVGRLDESKLMSIGIDFVNTIFYLAGSPSLVDDFENILLNLGVESFNIRTDRFDGY